MKPFKQGVSFFSVVCILVLFTSGCSNGGEGQKKEVAISQVCEALLQELNYPEMADVSARYQVYYSLSADILKECTLFVCSSGAYPDELAVFSLKPGQYASQLKETIEARKAYLLDTWKDYKPEEVPKIENSRMYEYAGYTFYIISENGEKASGVLSRYFG